MKTLVIAEAGVNHNGNLEIARKLVDAAASAGADFVKFQTFDARRLATATAAKASYQIGTTGSNENQVDMLRRLELTLPMHEALIAHCRSCGIRFMSTGFDEQSVDQLIDLGAEYLKIPSGEITNLPFLLHVGSKRLPVILSSGMATLDEIADAIAALQRAGLLLGQLTLLHCTTAYPTPMSDVNLLAMVQLRERFHTAVGYSDHTLGIEVPIAAVALGATVVEKHITLDRSLPGPDHRASIEPTELVAMVAAIRNIEQALGDGHKRPAPSEIDNAVAVRKSLVAARNIKAGEEFSREMLAAKRPGSGISPMRIDEIVGRVATRDFVVDEVIEL